MPRNQRNDTVLRSMQKMELESAKRDLMIEAKSLRKEIISAREAFSIYDDDDETYEKDEHLYSLLEKRDKLLERIYSNKESLKKFSQL